MAGSGALANTTIDTFKDFPQVSFAIGENFYSIGKDKYDPCRWKR